jgi:bacterial/archaeal transporter family-2 protein
MNKLYLFPIVIALGAGAVLPLQAMLNAQLGRSLGAPTWAGAVSAALSALVLLGVSIAYSGAPTFALSARQLHPGVWLGGLLGALYIFAAIYCVRALGAAGMVACMLLGQLLGALFLDWSGLLGPAVTPSLQRIAGCSLAAIGVVLATRGA